jgi:hypothetical protein
MLKRYTFWLWAAVVFQFLTAVLHGIGVVSGLQPSNDAERHLIEMINSTRLEADGVFTPSFANLFTALSSCFSLLCLLGGLTNAYLLKRGPREIMNGILPINILVFGACFAIMLCFTFLPPIVSTGLIFVCLLVSYVCFRAEST